MLGWAIVFAVLAIIAGYLGFMSLAGIAATIAKILFFVFLVLFVVSLVLHLLRGRGVGPGPPEPQLPLDLGQRAAHPGAQLDLLGHELGHEVAGVVGVGVLAIGVVVPGGGVVLLDGLPLAPARGHLERLGPERDRVPARVDDQQLLLDPHRAHVPMIATTRRPCLSVLLLAGVTRGEFQRRSWG